MATIETAEGDTLIVERKPMGERLWLEARAGPEDGVVRNIEMKLSKLYKNCAEEAAVDRPTSRSDLTADTLEEIANLLVGWVVADGRADRRSDVEIDRMKVVERQPVREARPPYVPDWEDSWPEDGSSSEQVRWLLDEMHTYSDEEIAAIADCSRSLVSDVKASRGE